jgi:septal ring factor EnvC (AmiA/AmiB activator)
MGWPTKGHILDYFGTKIYHSELRWSGILIKAPENQKVHAIANGKIVFANWLPGYGLLLIINHGHGYMSLYGRDHSLKKKVGDMVKKGDVIATVGKSGGYRHSALYFAIRHNAEPLSPKKWCH